MFYVFHGEDEFSRAVELLKLRGKLAGGDQTMAELNTTILDGSQLTLAELRHVCDVIPFMADRRLVIVHGLLGRLAPGRKDKRKKASEDQRPARKHTFLEELSAYLPTLPPTTRLIFVESRTLSASHLVLKLAKAEGEKGRAYVKLFSLPREWELPGWIRARARAKGGDIDGEAASLLAKLVGRDLRQLDQELDKLLIYADERSIQAGDVRILVSRAREANIFDLVDSVGRRHSDLALQLLHRLLDDGEAPLYLLAMLARQVRILIQVSELRAQGLAQDKMAARLKLHRYVVEKGLAQSRNFDLPLLEAAHRRIVETDWSIKTGRAEDILALDLLVVELCGD
ncbi:DNA polymerase III subunit delta [Chloroflexota bacterium]